MHRIFGARVGFVCFELDSFRFQEPASIEVSLATNQLVLSRLREGGSSFSFDVEDQKVDLAYDEEIQSDSKIVITNNVIDTNGKKFH